MKKAKLLEIWEERKGTMNKRAIFFVRRCREYLEQVYVEVNVCFLLSGTFSVVETTSAIGKHDSLKISIPDWEGSPNIGFLDVEDVLEVYFPSEEELQEIFGGLVDVVPEGYAPFLWEDSAPQMEIADYVKGRPSIISAIERTFFPRIMVVCAHDDDSILGVGGKIMRHIAARNKVHVVICHDGRTSHRAVFGREERPSLKEVGDVRKNEIAEAMGVIGVSSWEILDLPCEEGRPSQNPKELHHKLAEVFDKFKPSVVYFHLPDAHSCHRAVAEEMGSILHNHSCKDAELWWVESFQFMIWSRQLAEAQQQSNMDPAQAPEIPDNAIIFKLSEKELEMKRRALHCMKSQVQIWPYPEWDPQPCSVLNEGFINYFLRGEEILIPVR